MATENALNRKPYAGNTHVRVDEGKVAPAATPRRGFRLCKNGLARMSAFAIVALMAICTRAEKSAYLNGYEWWYDEAPGDGSVPDGVRIWSAEPEFLGAVTIPSALGGYPVTEVSLEFPEGVTSVTFPSSVWRCDECIFASSRLTSVGFSSNMIFLQAGFDACTSLASLTIPSSVKELSIDCSDCTSLTSLTIPALVQELGIYTSGCTSLNAFAVESGNAFYAVYDGCLYTKDRQELVSVPGGKRTVALAPSARYVGGSAFSGCTLLARITADNNPYFKSVDGVLYDANMKTLVRVPPASSSSSFAVPAGVTRIGAAAFSGCSTLTRVTLPDSVTTIGIAAFSGCGGLTRVTIPNGVTSIGNSVFRNCRKLTSLPLPNSVMDIGNFAFQNCSGLANVKIPNSV